MNKYLHTLLIVAPLSLALSGCVVSVGGEEGHSFIKDSDHREYDNRKEISNIKLNTSYNEVYNILGVADFKENYLRDGVNIQVLFYRTHRLHKDGLTTKDECTYLHFADGVLTETGSGEDYTRNIKG